MQIPIACQLTESGARDQMGKWRAVLATAVVAADRVSETRLDLRLGEDLNQLGPLVRLAQSEKACCPFFDFSLGIEADAVSLRISVPAEAAPILDDFRL
jgi:hypothetical protein